MPKIAFCLAATLLATPCVAETLLVAPVFSQIVAFTAPDGFQDGDEINNGPSYLHEIVPNGETVNAWSQMITLSGAKDRATGNPAADAVAFAQLLADGYKGACPDSFTAEQLNAPAITGAVASFAFYVGCGTVQGSEVSESMVALVIVGSHDIYTLQWAERVQASAKPEFKPDHWLPRLGKLATGARICAQLGEAPPYPSCTG
jgi:hypothetical protein